MFACTAMLMFIGSAHADTLEDDFSADEGWWVGGEVSDGVLTVSDDIATLNLESAQSFSGTIRVRQTDEGAVSLVLGDSAIETQLWRADYQGDDGISMDDGVLPMPQGHRVWVPDDDPIIEPGFGGYWDGGNTLHVDVHYDEDSETWFLFWTGEYESGYAYRQIGLATSDDMVNWTTYSGNPVLTIDKNYNTPDGIHVHMPTVVVDDGIWHMFYACYQNDIGNRICHATSPDGYEWTPSEDYLVAVDQGGTGEFDEGSLRSPDVLIDDDGVWHMLYNGTDPTEHYGPTGYATSEDGYTWTKHGKITEDEYRLQYGGIVQSPYGLEQWWNCEDVFCESIADPSDWTEWEDYGEVVLAKAWAPWNTGYIQAPSPWLVDTTYHMWFNGYESGTESIAHAQTEPLPGTWFDLTIDWDGETLSIAMDSGPALEASLEAFSTFQVIANGTVELDDLSFSWEPLNTPPQLDEVTLAPEEAYELSELACTEGTATDEDGDSISFSYAWTVDGVDLEITDDSLDGDEFDKGESVVCWVTPNDGTDDGDTVKSNTVIILNTAPEAIDVEISPETATTTDELSCGYSFSDDDGDDDESIISWTVEGDEVGSDTTLSGEFVGGQTVTCTVTPIDDEESGAEASTSITIDNTAPVLADVTLSPDDAYEADTLYCLPGDVEDDDGTESFDYTYAWIVDGVDIGEIGDTLDGDSFDKGQEVYCTVIPNDGDDDGDMVESNTITIVNTPPTIDSASIDPTEPFVDDELSCSWSGFVDDDGDDDESSVMWSVNGEEMGATEDLLSIEVGDTVTCTVTAYDGEEEGNFGSVSVTIQNHPPQIMSLTLDTEEVYTDDTVTATVTAEDGDGDDVTLTYAWYVDGALVLEGVDEQTLDGATYFDKEEQVVLVVTPNDGFEDGDADTSETLTIRNTPPVVTLLEISPDPATANDVLSCDYTFGDADGDDDESRYEWTVAGIVVGTHADLDGVFAGGDSVTCTITPHDGADDGIADSVSITIENTTNGGSVRSSKSQCGCSGGSAAWFLAPIGWMGFRRRDRK